MEIQGFVEEINFSDLHFLEVVGRGAFGVVSRARWRCLDVAVKLIETESERRAFITELKQLSRISHPHIVKLYGACTRQPVCLVMEYAEGGSLYNVLHGSPPIPKYSAAHAASWALQCARGVEYLHGMKPKALIHRDLKPPNLLLVNGGTVLKICDFGTACDAHTHMTNNKGSAAWMAPEVFEGSNYSEKCDVFSWGIILWEIIARRKPFEEIGGSAFRVMWAVHGGKRPSMVKDCPKSLETLMTRCWSANPVERPSMSEVVRIMTRFSQMLIGEDQPLLYPLRRDSYEERMERMRLNQSAGHAQHFDSRSSTMRATIRQPDTAFDSELVPQLVTPARRHIVVEENTSDLRTPSSRSASRDSTTSDTPAAASAAAAAAAAAAAEPMLVTPSQELFARNSVDPLDLNVSQATPPKPPVRTHRRTGSHGAMPLSTVAQQQFVPGHRRSGSQGNAVLTGAQSVDQLMLPSGNMLPSVTTAPGNLEDVQSHDLHNNLAGAAGRSVSWTPGLWPQGSGSAEDVHDASWNFMEPQLKPVPPCTSSPESVEIYNQHLKMIDDYMKIQAEILHLEQRKDQLMAELNVDEKDRLNRLKNEYQGLLTENDELKLLYTNLQKQVSLIREPTLP